MVHGAPQGNNRGMDTPFIRLTPPRPNTISMLGTLIVTAPDRPRSRRRCAARWSSLGARGNFDDVFRFPARKISGHVKFVAGAVMKYGRLELVRWGM